MRLLVSCLSLCATGALSGQTPARQDSPVSAPTARSGNWGARTSTGRTLVGTWTALPDPTTGTVTGSWAVVDARGRSVASGAWSASKSTTQWTGNWRAVMAGRAAEYTGTWKSSAGLAGDASFGDLFEHAVEAMVSGTWRAGMQSGAWSIRSAKEG